MKRIFLSLFFLGCSLATASQLRRRADDPPPTKYPVSIPVGGNMSRTDVDLEDGFAIDILSPSNHTLTLDRNFTLVPAFVVSTGGGSPWVHVNNYSWVLKTDRVRLSLPTNLPILQLILSKAAQDVVGKIEAP